MQKWQIRELHPPAPQIVRVGVWVADRGVTNGFRLSRRPPTLHRGAV